MKRSDDAQLGLFHTGPGDVPAPPSTRPQQTGSTEHTGTRRAPPDSTVEEGRPPTTDAPLPDQAARDRIRTDLDANLLVEAGAGSGKTTALVDRMIALVRTGTAEVEEIAAVTFTRKAAAELRERLQVALETELARAGDPAVTERIDRALRNMDRAFVGTIHSFCARLLRERPIEAGLDPGFRELLGPEEMRLRHRFWRSHLERIGAEGDPLVDDLVEVGLSPSRLRDLFDQVVGNPDVTYPVEPTDPPAEEEIGRVRRRLLSLLARGTALLPDTEPEKGWDDLQKRIRSLRFLRSVRDWSDRTTFLEVLAEEVHGPSCGVTQYRWGAGRAKAEAKALGDDWREFRAGPVQSLLEQWWAHRYPKVVRFVDRAAQAFGDERRRTGRLSFGDLLMLAARLLRNHPQARQELGERFRRVLVDEFQDTDPVQAEVLFLLASPPGPGTWQDAEPRPGALFVVGDPKQSIYRFRRADIAVYGMVRDRFRQFGAVVELVTNFRSRPPIGELVDHVFGGTDGLFPEEPTVFQAPFARLRTRRPDGPGQGIHLYDIQPDGRSNAAIAEAGARQLAPWIRAQIDQGRRRPEDFLVLARRRVALAPYARALEAWRIPVQVTGAGIDAEEELRELLVLLEALSDPDDPVKVLAVLTGPFFGLDHEQLVSWALKEDLAPGDRPGTFRGFSLTAAPSGNGSPVGSALDRLRGWWRLSQGEPGDLVVARIVDELALLPLAAARELGGLRAGALLYAVDAVRAAALQGDTSLGAALDAIRTALDSEDAEAPLEPASEGGVRVMTLHQAKGLEAPVVVLAYPRGGGTREPTSHVERRPDGSAVGYLVVQEWDRWKTRVHARPAGWEAKAERERAFDEAEQDRLLYVAATRAEDVLLVERQPGKESSSPWSGLHAWIEQNGATLTLRRGEPPPSEPVRVEAAEIVARTGAIGEERRSRGRPGYVASTVTMVAKTDTTGPAAPAPAAPDPDPAAGPDPAFRGLSWGSAVHGALNAAARGVSGARLRSICRSLLLEEERPVKGGEPLELDELMRLVERVFESDLWARGRAAQTVLSEVPFAAHVPADRIPDPADQPPPLDAAPRILEGVIDLAIREPDGWVIADYKTDVGTDPGFPERWSTYRRQVELYAAAWERITGEAVKERVLLFTARTGDDAVDAW
jgi:ATP-dependent helicase/nuclease subunit A